MTADLNPAIELALKRAERENLARASRGLRALTVDEHRRRADLTAQYAAAKDPDERAEITRLIRKIDYPDEKPPTARRISPLSHPPKPGRSQADVLAEIDRLREEADEQTRDLPF